MPTTAVDSPSSKDLPEHCNRPVSQLGAKRCPPPKRNNIIIMWPNL